MKKLKVLLSVLLVVCMVAGFAPLHATASADWGDWVWYWSEEYRNGRYWNGWRYNDGWYELSDKWYQVDFSPVKIPVEVNTPGTASNAAAKAAGSTVQMVDTSFSYFYNEWAGVLIIRGTGEMPSFSKEYPAPWANLKDKAARVIIERNITKISSNAFVDFSRLKSVILPATLKSIDPDAFVWSEETRALKTFRPLERLEFSGDLDTLDKILKAANIKDLLDARIVKVTEKDIQDEIWQLTWYRIRRPVRVKYDKAGRPILIERVEDGKFFRTAITWDDTLADGNVHSPSQPLSKETGNRFTRDVIEKRETYSVNQNGVENLYEFEKNDLGQTTYFAAFHLDNGVITGGSQVISDETGVTKTGTIKSISKVGEETQRQWENVLASGGSTEQMLEVLDKFGRLSRIEVNGNPVLVNNYYDDGRLKTREVTDDGIKTVYQYNYNEYNQLQDITTDKGNTISYTYTDINGESVLSTKVQTQGNTTVTSYYTLYNRVAQEVFTDNTNAIQYIYSYEYDSNGVVSKRIITDKDGKLLGTDTFNSAGVRISSERTGSVPLPTLKSVRPKLGMSMTAADPLTDGVQLTDTALSGDTLTVDADSLVTEGDPAGDALLPMMTTMVRTTYDPETGSKLSETVETTDGITTSKTAYTFNNLGLLTDISSSFTDEEGKTSDFSLKSSYDADGNIATQTEETSDFDNNSKVSKYIFGKLSKPLSLDVTESGEDGTLTARSFSTFLYRSDGGILETVTEMDADGMVANSYFINHDAQVDDEDEKLPDEDEEVTDEDEEIVEEDEEITKEDKDVTDEEDEEIEAGKVPLAETPAAEDDEDKGGADPADDEDNGDTDPADNEDEVGTDPADDEDEGDADPADDEDEVGTDPADDDDEVGTDPADDEGGNEEDANTTGDELTAEEKEKLRKLKEKELEEERQRKLKALEEAEKAKTAEASQKSETPAAETKPAAEPAAQAQAPAPVAPAPAPVAPAPVAPAPAPVVEVPVTPVEEPAAQDVAEEAA